MKLRQYGGRFSKSLFLSQLYEEKTYPSSSTDRPFFTVNVDPRELQVTSLTVDVSSLLCNLMISVINGQYFGCLPTPAILFLVKGANCNAKNNVSTH